MLCRPLAKKASRTPPAGHYTHHLAHASCDRQVADDATDSADGAGGVDGYDFGGGVVVVLLMLLVLLMDFIRDAHEGASTGGFCRITRGQQDAESGTLKITDRVVDFFCRGKNYSLTKRWIHFACPERLSKETTLKMSLTAAARFNS